MFTRRLRAVASAALILLLVAGAPPGSGAAGPSVNWTTDNANPQGTNAVQQSQLVPGNSNNLTLQWSLQFPASTLTSGLNATGEGAIAPPLVVDGTVYVVMNDLQVLAMSASDGALVWSYTPVLNRTGVPVTRLVGHVHGLVYHDGDIWLSLPDCSAIALDALTGVQVDRISKICSDIPGNAGDYDYSGAPVAFDGDLLVWTASSVSEGTDAGRGFVAAYNITTNALVWRWYVSPPAGGDPTWDTDSCLSPCHGNVSPYPGDWGTMGTESGHTRAGASPSWGQPAVDQADGVVLVSTSQASPDWNATYRPGPDLYSDSILALSLADGHLEWFFQTTPHDLYDFDCGWNLALANVTVSGSETAAAFKSCKNGFVYAVDVKTGNLLWQFNPPTLERLNTSNADYTKTGTYDPTLDVVSASQGYEQCPGINGGVESDISVSGGKVFVATHNFCSYITAGPVSQVGSGDVGAVGIQYDLLHDNTTIYALDAGTGRPDWSYAIAGVPYRGWLTSTGGLVFASTLSGDILALDQATGALVGETKVGTPLYEGVTVGSDASGNVLVFQLTSEPSYGAFTNAVPGALLALSPGGQTVDYLPWVLTAAAAGVATVVLAWLFIGRTRRTAKA